MRIRSLLIVLARFGGRLEISGYVVILMCSTQRFAYFFAVKVSGLLDGNVAFDNAIAFKIFYIMVMSSFKTYLNCLILG